MVHSFLIESVRPDVVQELLQLLACGTRHTNRRKDEHYGLFDISWKTVCAQDICFITFINDLLDNTFTHGVLIECCAVNNTFCLIPAVAESDWLFDNLPGSRYQSIVCLAMSVVVRQQPWFKLKISHSNSL